MAKIAVEKLEQRIQDLINLCNRLAEDKNTLQAKHDEWMTERARLLEQDELTKARLKAMLDRLHVLEQQCA